MVVIKDSMVLIHLAKLSLLEKSCDYFSPVLIPELVYKEILKGKDRKYPDVPIIIDLINRKKILTKKIKDKNQIKRINQFNIQKGEAEAIALYWQEKADLIATDDDNVRKKKLLLNLKIVGTPAIILNLYHEKKIDKEKLKQSVSELQRIGWFSNAVLDKIIMEVN